MIFTWEIFKFLAKRVTQILPITCQDGSKPCHWNFPVKEVETFIMPYAWHYWGSDLSVSHLDSVARGEKMSFSTAISKQRRYHRPIEWSDGVADILYCITCSCRREALSVVAEVRTPFCLGVLEYPMFGQVVEEAKEINTGYYALPLGIPIFVLLSSCLSCFWGSNLKLECRGWLWIVCGRGIDEDVSCNVDRLMPKNVACLETFSIISTLDM